MTDLPKTLPPVYSIEAKRAIAAVADDMVKGVVPTTVTDFAKLHDYVDANMYLIDVMPPMPENDSASGERASAEYEAWFDKADAISSEVDVWLSTPWPRDVPII